MAVMTGFVGPTNVQRSRNVDAERTINWYPEASGAGTPKVALSLQPTLSVTPFVVMGTGPVRGLFAQDGRAFAVSGAYVYEFFASQTSTIRGTVRVDGRPATISSNGKAGEQLMITSGGLGYVLDLQTNVFAQITDVSFPTYVSSGLFFDGYFIVLDGTNGEFFLSSLEDGETWNALDFGAVSQFSDKVITMTRTHDNLMLGGSKNTQAWYNSGAANFPFAPVPGGTIEHGMAAEFGAVELDNTLFYVGQDEHGAGAVWKLQGYTPIEISTQAIRHKLTSVPSLTGCLGWSYQWERHLFYVLYVPGLDTTLVYDVATDLWHEWAVWDSLYMRWRPHVGRNHAYGFNRHLIGDRQSGAIYTFDPALGSDRVVWTGQ